MTLATDAAELAIQVDGVLLTVAVGHTKRDDAQRAKELLERSAPGWWARRWSMWRLMLNAEVSRYCLSCTGLLKDQRMSELLRCTSPQVQGSNTGYFTTPPIR